ncbi:MAG: nitroreductase [Spirochaetales bacterium]|nr:MAG: nitroreductase [Spirochaetales bacterium]
MDILKVIQQRATARSFTGGEADAQSIERILEAGRLAPSAKNRQAWRFVAAVDEDVKKSIAEACYGDKRVEQASCIIAACTTNIQYTMPNGQPSYPLDLAFAVSYMDLQAVHEGLGSLILGTYNEEAVRNRLSVPYAMRVVLLLAIGPTDDPQSSYKNRFHRDRVISYNHW